MSAPPIVFLAGPPGSGKSGLGATASAALGLRFADLEDHGKISDPIARPEAEVVALPWTAVESRSVLADARRSGVLVGLWAHPVDMQARSGRTESLFTPSGRVSSRSSFGRKGTACLEFRVLDRACHEVLLLVGLTFDEAVASMRETITDHREAHDATPAQRAGIDHWVDPLCSETSADPEAVAAAVDAMGRYLMHRTAQGASSRKLRELHGDLQVGALLVLGYEAPSAGEVLDRSLWAPDLYLFRRKVLDTPNAVDRYARTMRGFADFLARLAPPGGDAP